MFEKIAVPLDGSELGEMALVWAARLAAAFNSEVDLLSVCEGGTPEACRMRQGYLDHKAEELLQHISLQTIAEPSKARTFVTEGDAAARILEYAEGNDISLLLLVSHGRSGIMPWAMGSTASRVLSTVTKPVLFVRARKPVASPEKTFERILVPLDGSARGESVIPYVEAMVARLNSKVVLLRAIEASYDVPSIGGVRTVTVPTIETDRMVAEASEYLQSIKAKSLPSAEYAAPLGNVANEIIGTAERNTINLIAMTNRGKTQSGDWRLGAIAHKVLYGSNTPILLAKVPPPTLR